MFIQPNALLFASLLIPAFLDFLLSFFVVYKNPSKTNIVFAVFCACIGFWTFCVSIFGLVEISQSFYWNLAFIFSAGLIPPTYLHFVYFFNKENVNLGKKFIFYFPAALIGIILIFYPEKFILDIVQRSWGKESILGAYYVYYGLYFSVYMSFGFIKIFIHMIRATGVAKQRYKYLLLATVPASLVGAYFNLLLILLGNYKYVWVGPYCSFIVVFFTAYSIIKYRFMDIRLAFTQAGIFLFIYTIVLGIPFALGYRYGMWRAATWSMLILATIGPFLYMNLRRRAEQRLLQEELSIQQFLMDSSYSMTAIHDLKKLMELISFLIKSALQVKEVFIYLLDADALYYRLRFPQYNSSQKFMLSSKEPLIDVLRKNQSPIVCDELRMQSELEEDSVLTHKASIQMNWLSASVAIPITTNTKLLGFIILGERNNREIYSRQLLGALSVLGNQSALAIENCNFWEIESRRMEEEGFQQRIASLDMMASSFAHEIDNPMGIINGQLDFLSEVTDQLQESIPDHLKTMVAESFQHIREATQRVSGMIRAILDYSRMGTGELKPVRIETVVTDFLKLVNPKLKAERANFIKDVAENLPYVLGDKIQLEEVLMNFMTNALHAVKVRPEKIVTLKVYSPSPDIVRIQVEDNGYGIKKEMLEDIFLASVTTKGSSEGTGLGLYRIRKIADLHGGQVWAESLGEGKGATFIFEVPAYSGTLNGPIDGKVTKTKQSNKIF